MKTYTQEIGGRTMTISTGKFAGQASGSCTVRYGDTVVLATAVMSSQVRDGIDYFPLMVDYEERLYAAGKIKGSRFIKREGRPTDEAVLTARLIDRSVRPLFDMAVRNDVQVVVTVLSVDQENDPDVPSMIAASTALAISPIPWNGPIGGIRVGRVEGEWVINPSYEAREKSDLDLFVSGTREKVVMIEAGANQVSEDDMLAAITFAQKHMNETLGLIEQVVKEEGKTKIMPDTAIESEEDKQRREMVEQKVRSFISDRLKAIWKLKTEEEREEELTKLKLELDEFLKADNDVSKEERVAGLKVLEEEMDNASSRLVLEEGRRVDGRALDELRPISSEVSLLPRTHGSGLFARGETQVMSIVTLGSPGDELVLDTMEESGKRRYMHHYNFPAFSVGEVAPLRGPGRREIGHGALAEKALIPVLPDKEDFPYTIRVVSEVLSSNGSTSQASACGSSLALMDAGVPIKAPVAGIAMGLIMNEDTGEYKVLTDIQGIEDHAGGMDFKVAGTTSGITAIQLDIKVSGLSLEICKEALAGARKARMQILETMLAAIPSPRTELSPFAPRIYTLRIDPEQIREVIGRGGETINAIIEECGGRDITKIDIEEDGLVMITSTKSEMGEKALNWIKNMTREVQVGEIFDGKVTQIMSDRMSGQEIGAIVELLPGKDGMVHISEFSNERIARVSDVVQVGQDLKVKVVSVDKERGRIGLSVKALTEAPGERENRPPHHSRPHGQGHRGQGRFNNDNRRPFHRRDHN
ncbi:MAG: polyribonucleotide nucleotidyltransferase [Candidatus Nomurabacteria bacterium]|nr:MAG: polyribonucleotide nucleotidyltransferase [Candidatus Nomurabacteria bacterium]